MKFYRIIYMSEVNTELDPDTLIDLSFGSEIKNKKMGITGILIASKSHFIQALEGTWGELNKLYHRIARDSRHKNLRLISYDCICKKDFPLWTMKVFSIDDNKGISDYVKTKYNLEMTEFGFPTEKSLAFSFLFDVYKYFQYGLEIDLDDNLSK